MVYVWLPGNFVRVQFPVGKPLRTTLPVAFAQLGCEINPVVGAVGMVGAAVIITVFTAELQELASLTE